jgi:hypothetical protein
MDPLEKKEWRKENQQILPGVSGAGLRGDLGGS